MAAASAILIGHLFAMGEPAIRRPLVAFSVLRFPGLAFLILAAVPRGERLIPVVLAYILTSALLLAVYYAVSSARAQEATHPAAAARRGTMKRLRAFVGHALVGGRA